MLAEKISKIACMSKFGDRVKEAREAKEWSPADLASKVGVSRQAIDFVESGKSKSMKPEHLFKAADVLGVNARWLGTGKGPKNPELNLTINPQILYNVIMDYEKAAAIVQSKTALEKRCELITTMYEMYLADEKPSNVVRLVQLISKSSGSLI